MLRMSNKYLPTIAEFDEAEELFERSTTRVLESFGVKYFTNLAPATSQ